MKKLTVAVAGCGSRGQFCYAENLLNLADRAQIVAAADLIPEKLEGMRRMWGIPEEACYASAEEMLALPQLADAMFICTPDACHYDHARAALLKGYDLLLEKPLSITMDQCRKLSALALSLDRKVVVCHVLRYTAFFQKIKEIIDSGVLGDLASITHLERVAYWHDAHSYVRGNWRNEAESSCMIIAKCCHDLDLILWLTGKQCERLSSFGSLMHFRPENAPAGAPKRCTDGCPAAENCPYNAEKFYMGRFRAGKTGWPVDVVAFTPSEERLMTALREGPYGRCVYHCDNDVVDHQQVNMELEGGTTVSLTMTAFTEYEGRLINIHGTHGELQADMHTNIIRVLPYGKPEQVIDVRTLTDDFSGHGGGDVRMLAELLDLLQEGKTTPNLTSIDRSVESHLVALAAERSRVEHGRVIEKKEWLTGE